MPPRTIGLGEDVNDELFESSLIDERIAFQVQEDIASGGRGQSCKAEIREHCERLIERLAGRSPFHLNARLLTDPFVGMRGAALGFPRQRQWRHGECRGS